MTNSALVWWYSCSRRQRHFRGARGDVGHDGGSSEPAGSPPRRARAVPAQQAPAARAVLRARRHARPPLAGGLPSLPPQYQLQLGQVRLAATARFVMVWYSWIVRSGSIGSTKNENCVSVKCGDCCRRSIFIVCIACSFVALMDDSRCEDVIINNTDANFAFKCN